MPEPSVHLATSASGDRPPLGDPGDVLRRYDGICWKVTADLYADGYDREDLVQEARIAMLRAIETYDPALSAFTSHAFVVCRRRVLTVVTLAQADRRRANAAAVSLDAPLAEDYDLTLGDVVVQAGPSVAELVELRDEIAAIAARRDLSALERRGLQVAASETPYSGDKTMDNAIQRVRRKLVAPPAAVAEGGTLLVDRTVHPTELEARREAGRVRPGCQVITCVPRKVRGGRVVAPQGRADADGRLGRPVWALEIVIPSAVAA